MTKLRRAVQDIAAALRRPRAGYMFIAGTTSLQLRWTGLSNVAGYRRVILAPGAGAGGVLRLTGGRKHVIVHANDHGDEDDRVVEEVELDAGKEELQNAARHGLSPEVVMNRRLQDEQEVLDVMPELDHEC